MSFGRGGIRGRGGGGGGCRGRKRAIKLFVLCPVTTQQRNTEELQKKTNRLNTRKTLKK